jgi:hypothetical protein
MCFKSDGASKPAFWALNNTGERHSARRCIKLRTAQRGTLQCNLEVGLVLCVQYNGILSTQACKLRSSRRSKALENSTLNDGFTNR